MKGFGSFMDSLEGGLKVRLERWDGAQFIDYLLRWPRITWLLLLFLGSALLVWGFYVDSNGFMSNILAEVFGVLFGVLLTVALLDRLQGRREEKRQFEEDRFRYGLLASALRGWLGSVASVLDNDFQWEGVRGVDIDEQIAKRYLGHLRECQFFSSGEKKPHEAAALNLGAQLSLRYISLDTLFSLAPPRRPELAVLARRWHGYLESWRGRWDKEKQKWTGCLEIGHFISTIECSVDLIDYLHAW